MTEEDDDYYAVLPQICGHTAMCTGIKSVFETELMVQTQHLMSPVAVLCHIALILQSFPSVLLGRIQITPHRLASAGCKGGILTSAKWQVTLCENMIGYIDYFPHWNWDGNDGR